jgi:hypothetical protein
MRSTASVAVLVATALALVAAAGCGEPQPPSTSTPATMALPDPAASTGPNGVRFPGTVVDTRGCDPAGKSIAVIERDPQGRPCRWRYFALVRRGHGNVRVLTCEAADRNGDGKIDARYFYDSREKLVLEQRDMDFDGRAEFVADYSRFPTKRSLARARDISDGAPRARPAMP